MIHQVEKRRSRKKKDYSSLYWLLGPWLIWLLAWFLQLI